MAPVITPIKSFTNINTSMRSLRSGLGGIKTKTVKLNNILLKKTKVKRESIARNYILSQRRQESERRKNREDLIEASSIGGVFKRQAKAIASSTKGFLGRIMDFLGTLLIGWLMYNLPSIITMAQELIARMQRLYTIVTGFFNRTINIFRGFGNVLGAVGKNILSFDFTDSNKRVENAMRDLNTNFDDMQSQFDEGFRLLTTSLGEGIASGENAAPTGTQYPNQSMQEPSTPSGGGGTKYPELASMVVKGEGGLNSVNRGNAGDTPGGSKSIFGKDLSEMTVGEIMQAQKEGRVFAVGKYQFIPGTLAGAVSYTKTPLNSKFNSATQNKLFDYLIDVKRPEIGAYINGKSNDRRTAIQQLAREFASVGLEYPENGKKRGQSRYSGTGGNRASISPELAGSSLDKQRGIGPQKSQVAQTAPAPAPTSSPGLSFAKVASSLKGMSSAAGPGRGRLACVWAVNQVFKKAGMTPPWGTSDYVPTAESAMIKAGYQRIPIGQQMPGDLYIVAGQAHIGIVLPNGNIISNSSSGAKFSWEAPLSQYQSSYGGPGKFYRMPGGIASLNKNITQAQVASLGTQQRQQVSQQLSQQRNGPTVVVIEEDPPPQQQVSAVGGGGGGGIIPIIINPLNSFITKKLLLDLAYT